MARRSGWSIEAAKSEGGCKVGYRWWTCRAAVGLGWSDQ